MALVQELQEQVQAFVAGGSIRDLHLWLARRAPAIYEGRDARARSLSSAAWSLISELDAGERDEASVRGMLSQRVGSPIFQESRREQATGVDAVIEAVVSAARVSFERPSNTVHTQFEAVLL